MEEYLIGDLGAEKILTSLSQTTQPIAVIEEFQTANGLSRTNMPSVHPALKLLDLHQVGRSGLYTSLLQCLRDDLLTRINSQSSHELETLLDKSFPYIGFEELKSVPMSIMKLMVEVPYRFLKKLSETPDLYEVKRQIWMINDQLLNEKLHPMLTAYVEDPALVAELNELVVETIGLPSKRREQNAVLQELAVLIGKSTQLYASVVEYIKTLFVATGNLAYCTLRADLLMLLHDHGVAEIYEHDSAHAFAWCVDACMREDTFDSRRTKEVQTLFSGSSAPHNHSAAIGDVAMVFANPFASNCLLRNVLRHLAGVVSRKAIPKDDENIKYIAYLLTFALKANPMIKKNRFKIPHVKKQVIQGFFPILASQMLDDLTRDQQRASAAALIASSTDASPNPPAPSEAIDEEIDPNLTSLFVKHSLCKKRVSERDSATVSKYLAFVAQNDDKVLQEEPGFAQSLVSQVLQTKDAKMGVVVVDEYLIKYKHMPNVEKLVLKYLLEAAPEAAPSTPMEIDQPNTTSNITTTTSTTSTTSPPPTTTTSPPNGDQDVYYRINTSRSTSLKDSYFKIAITEHGSDTKDEEPLINRVNINSMPKKWTLFKAGSIVASSKFDSITMRTTTMDICEPIPPADIKGIIEKTAQFVAKHGEAFEQKEHKDQIAEQAAAAAAAAAIAAAEQQTADTPATSDTPATTTSPTTTTTTTTTTSAQPSITSPAPTPTPAPEPEKPKRVAVEPDNLLYILDIPEDMTALELELLLSPAFFDKNTILDRAINRFEWNQQEQIAQRKADEEADQERAMIASIDWHDFVVVDTIDFTGDDLSELPCPRTFEQLLKLEDEDTSGSNDKEEMDVEMETEMDMDMDMEPAEPKLRVVKDYTKATKPAGQAAPRITQQCPMCKLEIPLDEMAEHMRIELLKKRDNTNNQINRDSNMSTLAMDNEIAKNLQSFAHRRTDIFGDEEVEIGRTLRQEDNQGEKVIWDGHSGSIPRTQAAILGQEQNKQQSNQMTVQPQPPPNMMGNQQPPMHQMFMQPPPGMQGYPPGMMPPPPGMQYPPGMMPQGMMPFGGHMAPMPPGFMPPPPPPMIFDEPEKPTKKQKTEDMLVPEEEFIQQNPGPVVLTIESTNSEGNVQSFTITLQPTDTINIIKEKIKEQNNIAPNKQKLKAPGLSILKDQNTVGFYNFRSGTIISCGLKERGSRKGKN
eukprot:gene7360-8573_t